MRTWQWCTADANLVQNKASQEPILRVWVKKMKQNENKDIKKADPESVFYWQLFYLVDQN